MSMNSPQPSPGQPGPVASSSRPDGVLIVAREDLQNTFLCTTLNEQLEVPVRLSSDFSLPTMAGSMTQIQLVDAQRHNGEGVINLIEDYERERSDEHPVRVAFFNVSPTAEAVVCANYVGWTCLRGMFKEGATIDHLVRGLNSIINEDFWLPRGYLNALVTNGTRPPGALVKDPGLTQKEREILQILVLGKTNEEIASSLNISPHTVKTHVYNLYKKLGVNNRVEASNWAQSFLGRPA